MKAFYHLARIKPNAGSMGDLLTVGPANPATKHRGKHVA